MANDQNNCIEAMDIPSTLHKALELAQAQIERLKNKEIVFRRIEELIELD